MICLSIEANDFEECKIILDKYSFIEFRLDNTGLSLNEIEKLFSYPNRLTATCRFGKLPEQKRFEILQTAILAGASYIDLDINSEDNFKNSIYKSIAKSNCKLISSYHNFNETPDKNKIIDVIDKLKSTKSDIYKIVTKVNEDKDLIKIFSLYQYFEKGKLIAFGMGNKGKISRIVANYLGSPFTYASLNNNKSTAPGQIDFNTLKHILDLLK